MVRLCARALAPVTLLALIAACGNAPASSTAASASAGESGEGVSASPGGVVDMVRGPLAAGVTYVFPNFNGLAVTLPEDGWSASLPNGGDAQIAGTATSVYFLLPATIVSSDGTARRDWPSDPEQAKAQIEAVRGITIESSEPITVAGVDTELLHVIASGLSPDAPMFQTGSGEIGLNEGSNDVILLPIGDRLLFLSVESTTDQEEDAQVVIDGLSFAE